MKISSISFDKSMSIDSKSVFLDNKKQIVFIWRSNVWKSSLMNSIFDKKDLVKTSSLPWKTKTANFFTVNNKYSFVDLPWYGFAKLWEEKRKKLDDLINWYFDEFRDYISKIVIVLDSKIWPTQTDIDMYKYIQEFHIPIIFVLNKIDRLSNNEATKSKLHTEEIFFWQQVELISAKNWDWIWSLTKILLDTLTAK